jgi:alpha-N-acetylglucosamine transferase
MRENGLMAKRYILLFLVTAGFVALIAFTKTRPPTPDAFPLNNTRHALVSLLSVDGPQAWWSQQKYIMAAEKLARSFRKYSQLDMVLLVVDEYGALRKKDEQRLAAVGWMVHRMRSGIMPRYSEWNSKFNSAKLFSKLWVWRLTMYEQLLYTDLDTLFIHSPNQLFHMRVSSQNPAMALDATRRHYFNAGVILLRPSEDEYQRLIAAMDANDHHHGDLEEQDFLNIFYHGRITQLNPRFNRQVCSGGKGCLNDGVLGQEEEATLSSFDMSQEKNRTVILHFAGESKPWNIHGCVERHITKLCLFWKHYSY